VQQLPRHQAVSAMGTRRPRVIGAQLLQFREWMAENQS